MPALQYFYRSVCVETAQLLQVIRSFFSDGFRAYDLRVCPEREYPGEEHGAYRDLFLDGKGAVALRDHADFLAETVNDRSRQTVGEAHPDSDSVTVIHSKMHHRVSGS